MKVLAISSGRSSVLAEWSWEDSVEWLRRQPDQQRLVRACYFDDPLIEAAERFYTGDEWNETRGVIGHSKGRALDLGAGRGIASYALARDGWLVTALEPDSSNLVGRGAIESLNQEAELGIQTVAEWGEELPFRDGELDLVFGRQVLHHARDLNQLCKECFRVLKPGGLMIATREHVISKEEDLPAFLESHPLHRFYGGENAFPLADYLTALKAAGFVIKRVFGPYESIINFFPLTRGELDERCRRGAARLLGRWLAARLLSRGHPLGRWLLPVMAKRLSKADQTPGRLFSFVAIRPA